MTSLSAAVSLRQGLTNADFAQTPKVFASTRQVGVRSARWVESGKQESRKAGKQESRKAGKQENRTLRRPGRVNSLRNAAKGQKPEAIKFVKARAPSPTREARVLPRLKAETPTRTPKGFARHGGKLSRPSNESGSLLGIEKISALSAVNPIAETWSRYTAEHAEVTEDEGANERKHRTPKAFASRRVREQAVQHRTNREALLERQKYPRSLRSPVKYSAEKSA